MIELQKVSHGIDQGKPCVIHMASAFTKPQRKVLSTLRSLLRHVNTHFDNRTGTVLKKDVSPWTIEIMREFRANQFVKGREEVRALRTKAADILAGLQAVQEQKVLCRGACVGKCLLFRFLPFQIPTAFILRRFGSLLLLLFRILAGVILPVRWHQRRVNRVPHSSCQSSRRHDTREDPTARLRP